MINDHFSEHNFCHMLENPESESRSARVWKIRSIILSVEYFSFYCIIHVKKVNKAERNKGHKNDHIKKYSEILCVMLVSDVVKVIFSYLPSWKPVSGLFHTSHLIQTNLIHR